MSVFYRSFVLNTKVMTMSELAIDMMNNNDDDVLQFECWYHSVIDDVANLIRANGYDKVMLDIMTAVNRMENLK